MFVLFYEFAKIGPDWPFHVANDLEVGGTRTYGEVVTFVAP